MSANMVAEGEVMVRDGRRRRWFWMHDAVLDDHADIGPTAFMVYALLCRMADSERSSFPAQELIAKRLRVSSRTVRTALKVLRERGLIAVAPRYLNGGLQTSSVYTVVEIAADGRQPTSYPVGSQPPTGAEAHCRQRNTHVKDDTEKVYIHEDSPNGRKTPFPPTLTLTPEMAATATAHGCKNPALAFKAFRASAEAHDRRYSKWGQAWYQWCLHHSTFKCPCSGKASPPPDVDLLAARRAHRAGRV